MTNQEFRALLHRWQACSKAVKWIGQKSPYDVWRTCERDDWLLWWLAKLGLPRKRLVLLACDCASPALRYVPKGETRPRAAIAMARRWARGKASLDEVRAAAYAAAAYAADAAYAYAAADAADAADAYAAAYAAYAAAYAAYAAGDAYAAAAYAADAAYAAADAYAAAREQILAECAALIRREVPWSTVRKLLEAQPN